MEKPFDQWNDYKKKTDTQTRRPLFKEREVWWCSIGVNIGDEQNGKGDSFTRPVLVIRKFNSSIFIGAPLSTQLKDTPYYHHVHFKHKDQAIILSQIKLIDAKRFADKMGELPMKDFEAVKEKLKALIF